MCYEGSVMELEQRGSTVQSQETVNQKMEGAGNCDKAIQYFKT